MDKIDQSQIGGLDPESPDSVEPRRKVSRLLLLWPLAGVVGLAYEMIMYRPLDDMLVGLIGYIPCGIAALLINIAWRKVHAGEDVPSFLPHTLWLAIGCLFVPMVLLANGALDHSPVEQHRQTMTRTILEHGRRGGTFYYAECSSWRGRSREKLTISFREYMASRPCDPIIVETHRGALGIPLLVSVHRPE